MWDLSLLIQCNLNRILKVHFAKPKILKLINKNIIKFHLLIYLVSQALITLIQDCTHCIWRWYSYLSIRWDDLLSEKFGKIFEKIKWEVRFKHVIQQSNDGIIE